MASGAASMEQAVLRPHGKWAWYKEDGSAYCKEGIYIGTQDQDSKYRILVNQIPSSFKGSDFTFNTELSTYDLS